MNSKIAWAAALGVAAIVGQAEATQMTGKIDFSSVSGKEVTLVGANSFLTATGLDFPAGPGNAQMDDADGSFAGEAGLLATFSDLTFTTATSPAWVTDDGRFTFSLSAGYTVARGAHFLTVDGTGIVHDTTAALEDTVGTYILTTQGSPSSTRTSFSWSATTDVTKNRSGVPDGGATAILLGVGLLGLGACSMRKGSNIA